MLSRATAGEIKANFIAIGIHQILDLWLGNSEKNLHQLFQLARDNAPTVLFFDEVDALAADRNDLRRSAGRTLINQFLAELDGIDPEVDRCPDGGPLSLHELGVEPADLCQQGFGAGANRLLDLRPALAHPDCNHRALAVLRDRCSCP